MLRERRVLLPGLVAAVVAVAVVAVAAVAVNVADDLANLIKTPTPR